MAKLTNGFSLLKGVDERYLGKISTGGENVQLSREQQTSDIRFRLNEVQGLGNCR